MQSTPLSRPRLLLSILLLLLTLGVFGQVIHHWFLDYDDDLYVTSNHQVHHGLTPEGVAWAFTSTNGANWHPLTMLSHMLDVEFFGLDPGWHHMGNLLLHAANVLLLFLLLARMTGSRGRSVFVAALFAVHPLHVESVAWVAARKDVLSLFFMLLALGAYLRYVERPGTGRRAAVALLFAFGLMSKPVVVTFPFLLLLLDLWPLGRLVPSQRDGRTDWRGTLGGLRPLVREKAPLFLLAAACCVVTYLVQSQAGAVGSVERYPLAVRAGNALVAYTSYLGKTVWPVDLVPFYTHPGRDLPLWKSVGAGLLLLLPTVAFLRQLGRRPWLAAGWLWFLGSLVPMIGLVQVGDQAMADRYSYMPLIGLFVAAVWGVCSFGAERGRRGRFPAVVAAAVLLVLAPMAWRQAGFWRDDVTLFGHALEVDPANWFARVNLGSALDGQGRHDEAMAQYREAIRVRNDYPLAHYNLGVSLFSTGKVEEAIASFRTAVALKPDYAEAHNNLGTALFAAHRTGEAAEQYTIALRLNPRYVDAEENLALALEKLGLEGDAAVHFAHVLKVRPDDQVARRHLDLIKAHRDRHV